MAETGIFASNAMVVRKAGKNASSFAIVEAYTNDFLSQAESEINVATRYNWSDNYDSLNEDVRKILTQAASNLAAMYVINYDMSGFTSRYEAETMLDVLNSGYLRCLSLLRAQLKEDFINDA